MLWLLACVTATRLRALDHPDSLAACDYCDKTDCGDCHSGKCKFAKLEWGKGTVHPSIAGPPYQGDQDFCSEWTWHCGTQHYFTNCPDLRVDKKWCGVCAASGCGDCYAGMCAHTCTERTFNCGPLEGMRSCAKLDA